MTVVGRAGGAGAPYKLVVVTVGVASLLLLLLLLEEEEDLGEVELDDCEAVTTTVGNVVVVVEAPTLLPTVLLVPSVGYNEDCRAHSQSHRT